MTGHSRGAEERRWKLSSSKSINITLDLHKNPIRAFSNMNYPRDIFVCQVSFSNISDYVNLALTQYKKFKIINAS